MEHLEKAKTRQEVAAEYKISRWTFDRWLKKEGFIMKNYLIFFVCIIAISFSCEKEKSTSAISSARQELLQLSSSSLQKEKFVSFSSNQSIRLVFAISASVYYLTGFFF
ncbi:MAG: hypothetical protein SH848_01205 [Saprospiraceae bacterium]|nr:hypothetical protein [Saprospiraceae bacterium]MDZ4702513.1 hypothetical protein [Saprospiraceae bacterium]